MLTLKKNPILILAILLICFSCKTKKLFNAINDNGTIVTCDVDSTSLFNKDTIIVSYALENVNGKCKNKPSQDTSSLSFSWPSTISFSKHSNYFFYTCNPNTKTIDELGEPITIDISKHYLGTYSYNKKTKVITLLIPEYTWQKKFQIQYDKRKLKLHLVKTTS
jgi:hypothetical protein